MRHDKAVEIAGNYSPALVWSRLPCLGLTPPKWFCAFFLKKFDSSLPVVVVCSTYPFVVDHNTMDSEPPLSGVRSRVECLASAIRCQHSGRCRRYCWLWYEF